MTPRRFDAASAVDALRLTWGLVGLVLFHVGARMIVAGDDALWTDWDEAES
jgi:hypothetical protein